VHVHVVVPLLSVVEDAVFVLLPHAPSVVVLHTPGVPEHELDDAVVEREAFTLTDAEQAPAAIPPFSVACTSMRLVFVRLEHM
jgi:hypothetical protein